MRFVFYNHRAKNHLFEGDGMIQEEELEAVLRACLEVRQLYHIAIYN